jgi:hypothetical protein
MGMGTGLRRSSKRVPVVLPASPAITVSPVISGTLFTNQTLSCTQGTWSNTPTGYAYQWKRNGVDIAGATATTYATVNTDAATTITCAVTASNAAGNSSATSAGVAISGGPSNTVAPAVTGTATVGQTLSCTTGTWLGNTGNTYTYQWRRGGTNISGATASTYLLVSADAGQIISCVVTATNTAGNASATSNNTAAVSGGTLALSGLITFPQHPAISALDIPFTTVTGNILIRIVSGDSASSVDDPWALTFDIPGANLPFTIHKFVSAGQAAGRAKIYIGTVRGVPITGVPKNIHFQTATGSVSAMAFCICDLPSWWSGAVGPADATAVLATKNSHTSPAIVTTGANSLLVGAASCLDSTLGVINISGQGGTWALDTPQFASSNGSTSAYNALMASKLVAAAGTTVDYGIATASLANSTAWSAGLLEIKP